MNVLKIVPYGFTDIYGIVWWPTQVDNYNKIQKDIHFRKESGYSVSDRLLNESHMCYQTPWNSEMAEAVRRKKYGIQ